MGNSETFPLKGSIHNYHQIVIYQSVKGRDYYYYFFGGGDQVVGYCEVSSEKEDLKNRGLEILKSEK